MVTGAVTVDIGLGRRTRPLGPRTVDIEAPRDVVFDLVVAPHAARQPRAFADMVQVLERGDDVVLAAHRTPVAGGLVATTVETVWFNRAERVDFRLVRGPVVNLFAAQCPPCLLEMPWFEQVAQQHIGDVLMVGIDIGPFIQLGTHEQGEQLLHDLGITYPAGAAVDDTPVRRFEVISMPTTVFFDRAGEVAGRHSGILTQGQIEDWFAQLAAP